MKIGILGGTGLDDPDILCTRSELIFDKSAVKPDANGQPADYGQPSDNLITGTGVIHVYFYLIMWVTC